MKKAAQKALSLDENLSEAHIAMGHYLMQYEWDWEGGKREFTQAIANNKNSTDARIGYASYLCTMKRTDEALKQLEPNVASGEYYVTDVPSILKANGKTIELVQGVPEEDVLSINTPQQLAEVEAILTSRSLEEV